MDGIKWFNRNVAPKQAKIDQNEKDKYSLLRGSSDDSESLNEPDVTPTPKKKNKLRCYSILFAQAVLIFFALWGLYSLGRSAIPPRAKKPVSCSCGGTTIQEAKDRGCVFTPLALGWLPPQCLDMELSDDFDKQGPLPGGEWPYWADLNGTTRMTREQMSLLPETEGAFFTTQEWHIMHCMYTWRKHYRSQFNGLTVENRSNGIDHIQHCTTIMVDRAPLQKIHTMAGVELNTDLG